MTHRPAFVAESNVSPGCDANDAKTPAANAAAGRVVAESSDIDANVRLNTSYDTNCTAVYGSILAYTTGKFDATDESPPFGSLANRLAAAANESPAYRESLTVLILICSNGVNTALPTTSALAAHATSASNPSALWSPPALALAHRLRNSNPPYFSAPCAPYPKNVLSHPAVSAPTPSRRTIAAPTPRTVASSNFSHCSLVLMTSKGTESEWLAHAAMPPLNANAPTSSALTRARERARAEVEATGARVEVGSGARSVGGMREAQSDGETRAGGRNHAKLSPQRC
jgi:hypothetical protein